MYLGHGPLRATPGVPVGAGLRPRPVFRGRRRFCRVRPMCRPVDGSRAEACPGGHTGPPLRGGGEVFRNQRKLAQEMDPVPAGRDGTRPYRGIEQNGDGRVRSPRPTEATQVVPSNGPMYLGHGFRRPNFVSKFGASVMGIGPYGEKGELPQPPKPAAHSGASAPRMQGAGGNRSKDHPQRGQQPRAIPQSRRSRASSLYTREPCPAGDEGRHPFQPRLPRQRLAKRKARKEELVKFGLCPMTALCSTAYWVRKSAESPARVPAEAVSTEQNGLEPRPAARQGASRARNCAATSVFSFDGSTAVFFLGCQKENGGGKPSIFIDASPPRPLGGGNPSVALTGDSSLYTREP